MAESFKSKRIEFKKGEQKKFIIKSKKDLGLTWQKFGRIIDTSVRSLTGWKNEKNLMSFDAVKIICKKTNQKIPTDINIKDPYWYVKKGALAGGRATYEKYNHIGGDEKIRKENWYKWWEKKGKYIRHKIFDPLPFKKPKHSEELAEFVGIVLGDGGISDRQITITLHRVTDKKYYEFVRKMVKRLFNIQAGKYCHKDSLADSIVISRTGLVDYFVESVGLKKGNKIKNKVDIPDWIMRNKKFQISCIRGLVDTDGSIMFHRYKSKEKYYCYKKLSYCSRSISLLKSAGKILERLNIKHRFTKNNYEIRIESQRELIKYFDLVGSHNPKHLKRYKDKI